MDVKTRIAVVEVRACLDYLTDDGEESEESGWQEVEKNLRGYLEDFNRFRDSKVPNASFVEWEE